MLATLLLISWAATMVTFVLSGYRHDQRLDRLTTLLISERASSDQRTIQLLNQHATDRTKPNPDTTALIALVERMAQRIQAPTEAVVEHQLAAPLPDSPPAIPFDNDQAFWEAQEPLSKEALADALMEAEAHG